MQKPVVLPPKEGQLCKAAPPARLYYLDWLRVIVTLGVFLFHASNVFNTTGFEIKNAETSEMITIIQAFFFPWGMPLFFLIAGARSWFALRRRTAGQFTRERTLRLLVPFFTGTILLGPIQLYLSWRHRMQTGMFDGTLLEFVADRLSSISPMLFGAIGYHMWFLGFLFAFSLLALPLFMWLKGEAGRRAVEWMARLCERRGAILPFFVVHQAVIIVIAYFVVQWNAGILLKMLPVFVGSFAVSLGLYELVIKRVGILRALFGMKA